jgi:TM2 domain-containing membrane protein YozV
VGRTTVPQPPQQPPRIVAISPDDGSAIDLGNPALAAVLSWAVPGLGQIYQGRTAKGGLFMAVILFLFVFGLWLGGGKVVYASWPDNAAGGRRGLGKLLVQPYVCQVAAGLVALPAMVQAAQLEGPARQPFVLGGGLVPVGFMAPPIAPGQYVSRVYADRLARHDPDIEADDFFDKPPLKQFRRDQLAQWHRRLGKFFEIGTLYTMLAGMLNLLVIYDAWAGPMGLSEEEKKRRATAAETQDASKGPASPKP